MDSKRTILSKCQTVKVIEIWKKYLSELRRTRRNVSVLQKMCKELHLHHNIKLSPTELRTRINNLTKKYRSEKKKMDIFYGSPSDWEHFAKINSFIGHSKSNGTEDIIIETIKEEPLDCNDDCNQLPQNQEDVAEFYPGFDSTAAELSSSSSSIPSTSEEAIGFSQRVARKKRRYSISYKLLELAKEETLHFKNFCDECIKNDKEKIELLRENNTIQKQLLNAILEKKD